MPKQKTHKATKKVLNLRNSGTITYKKSGGNHKTNKDSSKQVRQRKNSGILSKATVAKLKDVI
jgi:ribosomal protein L35